MLSIFSICGCSNVYSVRKIDDSKIESIQAIVRDDFPEQLESPDINLFQYIQRTNVYGLYAGNQKRFRFLPGDATLIEQIVRYVKSLVKDDNDIEVQKTHFDMPKKHRLSKKDLCWTPLGYLFGAPNKATNPNKCEPSNTNDFPSKETLMDKLNNLLKPFSVTLSEDSISFQNDGQKMSAYVSCVLCKNKNRFCVQFDASKATNKPYWNISNYNKHLTRHKNSKIENKSDIDKPQKQDTKKPKIDDANEQDTTKPKIDDNLLQDDGKLIIPTDLDGFTQLIYGKISNQNLKLTAAIVTYNEAITEMEFQLNVKRTVQLVKIVGDGNCLFASLAHQIFLNKVNSEEHIRSANDLRKRVVEHIGEHFDRFRQIIKWRLIEIKEENKNLDEADMEKETRSFVENSLRDSKCWGGTESLKAISEIEKVNILVFSEDDKCYFPFEFDLNYKRIVYIAYRLNSNNVRDHYDSVYEVSRPILYQCAVQLAKDTINRKDSDKYLLNVTN